MIIPSQRIIMGTKYTLDFKLPEVNLARARKSLYRNSVKVWRGAVGAYIKAAAEIVAKHQDTGMSLASLFPAARDAKQTDMPGLAPKTSYRRGFTSKAGRYYPHRFKSAGIGERLGEKTVIILWGNDKTFRFSMKFEIQIFQYILNEFGMGNSGVAAFESREKGYAAMQQYLNRHGNEIMPKFKDYATLKPISLWR